MLMIGEYIINFLSYTIFRPRTVEKGKKRKSFGKLENFVLAFDLCYGSCSYRLNLISMFIQELNNY